MSLEYELQSFKRNAKEEMKEPLAKIAGSAFFVGLGASVLDIFMNNNVVNLIEGVGSFGGGYVLHKMVNGESAVNKTSDQINKQFIKSAALLGVGFASKMFTFFFPPAAYVSDAIISAGVVGVVDAVVGKTKGLSR